MEQSHRHVAALVSLVSQALLLLLLSHPFSQTPSPHNLLHPSPLSPPPLPPHLLTLLLFNLFSSAASVPLLSGNKRKRLDADGDDDEEVAAVVPRANPDHFSICFRMSASTFEWLAGLLDPLLGCGDPAGVALRLPGPTRLALALARIASGAPYPDLARRFGVPEPTARFCAKRLCRVLCTNFRFWLAFPPRSELRAVSAGFLALGSAGRGLPDCCGAIVCARFGLGEGSTVGAQLVADSSSRILSIAAGFRQNRTDSDVLQCSSLFKDVNAGQLLGASQYLVGGSGYPLLSWLMIPFSDPVPGSCEEDFNAVHTAMCCPALRVVSSLRNWGALDKLEEEEDVKMAVACIGTCAILHNVLLMREDYSALSDVNEESFVVSEHSREDVGVEDTITDRKGFLLRSTLAVTARGARSSM